MRIYRKGEEHPVQMCEVLLKIFTHSSLCPGVSKDKNREEMEEQVERPQSERKQSISEGQKIILFAMGASSYIPGTNIGKTKF